MMIYLLFHSAYVYLRVRLWRPARVIVSLVEFALSICHSFHQYFCVMRQCHSSLCCCGFVSGLVFVRSFFDNSVSSIVVADQRRNSKLTHADYPSMDDDVRFFVRRRVHGRTGAHSPKKQCSNHCFSLFARFDVISACRPKFPRFSVHQIQYSVNLTLLASFLSQSSRSAQGRRVVSPIICGDLTSSSQTREK